MVYRRTQWAVAGVVVASLSLWAYTCTKSDAAINITTVDIAPTPQWSRVALHLMLRQDGNDTLVLAPPRSLPSIQQDGLLGMNSPPDDDAAWANPMRITRLASHGLVVASSMHEWHSQESTVIQFESSMTGRGKTPSDIGMQIVDDEVRLHGRTLQCGGSALVDYVIYNRGLARQVAVLTAESRESGGVAVSGLGRSNHYNSPMYVDIFHETGVRVRDRVKLGIASRIAPELDIGTDGNGLCVIVMQVSRFPGDSITGLFVIPLGDSERGE